MARTEITAGEGVSIGPYSQAIDASGLVFVSGQTPVDPGTGMLVAGGIAEQTARCLDNLATVLAAGGMTMGDVVSCNVFLVDMDDFAEMNSAYAAYFEEPYPARTTVAVAGLPLGARVEIALVAQRP